MTEKADIIGIIKIKPLYPDCSVFKKQVFIGLLPIMRINKDIPKIINVEIIDIDKYFLIFLPGFNIPSIGFKLIFLK